MQRYLTWILCHRQREASYELDRSGTLMLTRKCGSRRSSHWFGCNEEAEVCLVDANDLLSKRQHPMS